MYISFYFSLPNFYSMENLYFLFYHHFFVFPFKKPGFLQREIKNVVISINLSAGTPDKPVLLWPGDMELNKSQDNAINLIDIMELAKHFNSLKGSLRYSSQCDFNNDSTANMSDILIAAKNFNKTANDYPACTLDKIYND